jgi:Ca2+-binding RTX toxin-like protein
VISVLIFEKNMTKLLLKFKSKIANLTSGNLMRRWLMLLLLPFVVVGLYKLYEHKKVNEIYAVDPLVVTYDGHTPPSPVFSITNMLPGDTEEKTFNVKNDSPDSVGIVMFGTKTDETQSFATELDVVVTELPSTVIYTGKLQGFFDAGVFDLGSFPAGVDRDYEVHVYFPSEAGNEWQLASVVFDITWQTKIPDLPPECSALAGKITRVVEGTDGNDNIHASIANELILAKGGNDKVDASSGDDCVVLGDGNDTLVATSGNDIVLGGAGNDKINAGSENDVVYGGDGNDQIKSGSGDDIVYGGTGNDDIDLGTGNDKAWGEDGNDNIDGGNDDDEIHGGPGNDSLRGGGGNDKIYGDEDNDYIEANSGNDYVDGGSGIDTIYGGSGTDTCVNGESSYSCEI